MFPHISNILNIYPTRTRNVYCIASSHTDTETSKEGTSETVNFALFSSNFMVYGRTILTFIRNGCRQLYTLLVELWMLRSDSTPLSSESNVSSVDWTLFSFNSASLTDIMVLSRSVDLIKLLSFNCVIFIDDRMVLS